jgi:hypothetical protein
MRHPKEMKRLLITMLRQISGLISYIPHIQRNIDIYNNREIPQMKSLKRKNNPSLSTRIRKLISSSNWQSLLKINLKRRRTL